MSRGPLKTEIHCEIVEIRIIVDCIKYELNNCNTLSLFIFFILGDLSPRVSRRQQNRFVVFFDVALTSARGTDLKWWVDFGTDERFTSLTLLRRDHCTTRHGAAHASLK